MIAVSSLVAPPATDRNCSISGSYYALPAIQVPAVDSLSEEVHSSNAGFRRNRKQNSTSSDLDLETPAAVKVKAGGGRPRSRKPEPRGGGRTQQQRRHHRTNNGDVIIEKTHLDDVTSRMALRSSNFDWTKRIPDLSRTKDTGSGSYPSYDALQGGCTVPESNVPETERSGGFPAAAQENTCRSYLFPAPGTRGANVGPELLLLQGATMMGETGPAAEKLKQIAAQHQLKESCCPGGYCGDIDWYVGEYPAYQYGHNGAEIYSDTPYSLATGQYPGEAAAYFLQVPYCDDAVGIGELDFRMNPNFDATKPLSHYPIPCNSASSLGERGRFHGDGSDPTNQNLAGFREWQTPPSPLANGNPPNYVECISISGAANQLRAAPSAANDDVMNNGAHRTTMTQYGKQQQQQLHMQGKQGDSVSSNDALVPNGRTVTTMSFKDRINTGSCLPDEMLSCPAQLRSSPPFPPAVSSTATVSFLGAPSLGRGQSSRSLWTFGCQSYPVFDGSDVTGNGVFRDSSSVSAVPGTSLLAGSGAGSPLFTEKQKQLTTVTVTTTMMSNSGSPRYQPEVGSMMTNPKSSFNDDHIIIIGNGLGPWPGSGSQEGPLQRSGSSLPPPDGDHHRTGNPPNAPKWAKYYPPPDNPSSFSFNPPPPYPVENSAYKDTVPSLSSSSSSSCSSSSSFSSPRDSTLVAMVPATRDLRWSAQTIDKNRTGWADDSGFGHVTFCRYDTAGGGGGVIPAAGGGQAHVGTAAVPEFAGAGDENCFELFIYNDDDTPLELNFIDDILSTTR